MAKSVRRTLPDDCQYRAGVFNCPECGHEPKDWAKHSVILVLSTLRNKRDSFAIVDECPKCFTKSWHHHRYDLSHYFLPKSWREAIQKESQKKKLNAVFEWGNCLCWKCKKLTDFTVSHSHSRSCDKGIGSGESNCDSFKERT